MSDLVPKSGKLCVGVVGFAAPICMVRVVTHLVSLTRGAGKGTNWEKLFFDVLYRVAVANVVSYILLLSKNARS